MMNHIFKFAIANIFLISCASVVNESNPSRKVAPEGYYSEGRSGIVVYNPNGIKEIADKNRNAAFEKMFNFCGDTNKYEIVKEETVDAKEVTGAKDTIATFGANQLRRVEFRCLSTAKNDVNKESTGK